MRQTHGMAKGSIKVGDQVAITATVPKRVSEDRVSVLIPSYNQPHSIVDRTPGISSGQTIELTGEVLRVDEDTVTVGGKGLGITVSAVPCGLSPAMRRPSDEGLGPPYIGSGCVPLHGAKNPDVWRMFRATLRCG